MATCLQIYGWHFNGTFWSEQIGTVSVSGGKFSHLYYIQISGPLCLVTRWDLDKVGLFRSLQPSDSEGQRIVMTAIRWKNLTLLFTI